MTIKFGYGQSKLKLKNNQYLSGYAPIRKCEGEHDELGIKTNVFFDSKVNKYYIFTVLDVIAIDEDLTNRVEKKLENLIEPENFTLFLIATHTHSGPSGMIQTRKNFKKGLVGIFGEFDEGLNKDASEKIFETIRNSIESLEEFSYSAHQSRIENIGADRHQVDNLIDNKMTSFEITTKNKDTVLMTNYSCHPTVLSYENKLSSSDFLSEFYIKCSEEFKQTTFINGSSANVSTRFTRKDQSIQQAKNFGKSLYDQFLNKEVIMSNDTKPFSIDSMKSYIKLKTKNLNDISIELLEKNIQTLNKEIERCTDLTKARLLRANLEGIRATINMKEPLVNTSEIEVPYWFFRLDNFTCVLIPGEITSNLTEKIRLETKCLVFSMVNDYLFYFAEKEMFNANTYEAQSSFFAEGEAEKMMRKIEKEIKSFTCYDKMI